MVSLLTPYYNALVALFTRAWIEMVSLLNPYYNALVALFTRAWIEMGITPSPCRCKGCRPLYEGVD